MEAGVHVLCRWKSFHAIKKQPQTSSPGADQWCGVDVSVLEFHLQQLGSWHFYRALVFYSLCVLHNIPEVFFSAFPQQTPDFISVLLALLPVVLCDLPCSIFLLFSGFLPFILALFCSDWLSPSSQRGSVSVSFPCLHFPPSPTAVPSLSRSYRPLSCSQHHPVPSLFPLHVQPLSSITGGQQQKKQKMNQEGDVTAKNDCACEMPSIVSPALVWTAFIWLDELHPPAQALTYSFQCFMPYNLSLHPKNLSLSLCLSLKAISSAAGLWWGGNVHFISNFLLSPPCAALYQLSTRHL